MPIKLTTTHNLKTSKGYVLIAVAITCAVMLILGVTFMIQAMYRYFEIPWVFDLRLFTLDYLRKVQPIINLTVGLIITAAAMAAAYFLAHLNTQTKLRKSSGNYLTASQTHVLDTEAVYIIRNLFGIKFQMAENIWHVIKPNVIDAIQKADNSNSIDLTRTIKSTIVNILN